MISIRNGENELGKIDFSYSRCCSFLSFQIKSEIDGCLDFLHHVYGTFGLKLNLKLSTRPESFLGEIQVWDDAEKVRRKKNSNSISYSSIFFFFFFVK